jgi:capsular polysaccharide biosynthesis protein
MEEGTDLRQYVVVLVKHWKLIILATFLAALAAALFRFITPPVYEAIASVAIVKSTTEIVFSPEFRTLSEEQMAAGGIQAVNLGERRKALASLVVNSAIASQVIEELGSYLSQEEQNPSILLGMVEGKVGGEKGDLIDIVVSSRDPEKAARIANAWAKAYEEHVNALYGTSPTAPAAVRQQLEDAGKEYEEREQALVAFMAENEIDELNLLIEEKLNILQSLQDGKARAVSTIIDTEVEARSQIIAAYIDALTQNRLIAFNKEQEAKRELVSNYIQAQISSRNAVFNEQVSEKVETLAYYYDKKSLVQRLLRDARMLREVVITGGASSSTTNALAVLLLKAEAFASSGGLPGAMELQLGAVTGLDQGATAQAADLEALIGTLESELTALEGSIQDLSQELLKNEGYDFLDTEFPTDDPLSVAINESYPQLFEIGDLAKLTDLVSPDNPLKATSEERAKNLLQLQGLERVPEYTAAAEPLSAAVEKLHDEVDALRAELEQEEAQQRELTRARDLAWDTYSTLADKATEVEIAADVGGSQVRFAAQAVPPLSPAGPKKKQSIALAAMVGLMIGVVGAFGVEYLTPDFAGSAAIKKRIAPRDKGNQNADEEQFGRDEFSN